MDQTSHPSTLTNLMDAEQLPPHIISSLKAQLFDRTQELLCVVNQNEIIVFFNHSWENECKDQGQPAQTGAPLANWIHPSDHKLLLLSIRQTRATGVPSHCQARLNIEHTQSFKWLCWRPSEDPSFVSILGNKNEADAAISSKDQLFHALQNAQQSLQYLRAQIPPPHTHLQHLQRALGEMRVILSCENSISANSTLQGQHHPPAFNTLLPSSFRKKENVGLQTEDSFDPKQIHALPPLTPHATTPALIKVLLLDPNTKRCANLRRLLSKQLLCDCVDAAFQALGRLHRAAVIGKPYQHLILCASPKDIQGKELLQMLRSDPRLAELNVLAVGQPSLSNVYPIIRSDHPEEIASQIIQVVKIDTPIPSSFEHPNPNKSAQRNPKAPPQTTTHRPLIFVAEDSPVSQLVIKSMLDQLLFDVQIAPDGVELLSMLSKTRPVAILMDGQMPRMDGYEATRAIRERDAQHPHLQRIPIVALTADMTRQSRRRALLSGMDDYLLKPVTLEDLGRTLSRWIPKETIGPPPLSSKLSPKHIEQERALHPSVKEVLDPQSIEQLRIISNGTDELLNLVCRRFLAELPERANEIQHAAQQVSLRSLSRKTHALKSAARQLGAMSLGDLCEILEKAGREEDRSTANSTIIRFPEEIRRTIDALQKLIESLSV